MSDWRVGDLAVCVDASQLRFNGRVSLGPDGLEEGRTYRVSAVLIRDDDPWAGIPSLRLSELDSTGVAQVRFVKIRPDEHEACETEFVTLLKRSKRRVFA